MLGQRCLLNNYGKFTLAQKSSLLRISFVSGPSNKKCLTPLLNKKYSSFRSILYRSQPCQIWLRHKKSPFFRRGFCTRSRQTKFDSAPKKKKPPNFGGFCTRSRSRTGTVSHRCLRPARLPIPPSGLDRPNQQQLVYRVKRATKNVACF